MHEISERGHPEIKIVSDPVRLTILVGGTPHLLLRKRDLTGVQGWIALRDVPDGEIYMVEYSMARGDPIRCEYDTREKWQAILRGIYEQELFGDFA